jgi:hypothetical protein
MLRPFADTFRLLFAAPVIWAYFVALALLFGGQSWFVTSAALRVQEVGGSLSFIGYANIAVTLVALIIKWFLIRSLAGPDAPPGRFWPWLGLSLIVTAALLVLTAIIPFFAASTMMAYMTFLHGIAHIAVTTLLLPVSIWATCHALGTGLPLRPMRDLPAPSIWGFAASFVFLSFVVRVGSVIGLALFASIAPADSRENYALMLAINTGLFSALTAITGTVFAVVAARQLSRDKDAVAEVFS